MNISAVKCVQKKYNFQVVSDFSSIVESLDDIRCNEKILCELENIFNSVKEFIISGKDLGNIDCVKEASHAKILYFEKETKHGTFKIEGMHFSGSCFTCLHTHPEYVVDGVISGSLEEKIYGVDSQGHHTLRESVVRDQDSFRAHFDDRGYPHKVKAIDGPCIVLSLCLGHNKVESLTEAS
jgi:hypothetical protein